MNRTPWVTQSSLPYRVLPCRSDDGVLLHMLGPLLAKSWQEIIAGLADDSPLSIPMQLKIQAAWTTTKADS
jgi:hypothetical protein